MRVIITAVLCIAIMTMWSCKEETKIPMLISTIDAPPARPLVRVIYYTARDIPSEVFSEREARIAEHVKSAQAFFSDVMGHHGYERKTFAFNTDADGKLVVERVFSKHDTAWYNTELRRHQEYDEMRKTFGDINSGGFREIRLIFLEIKGFSGCGFGSSAIENKGQFEPDTTLMSPSGEALVIYQHDAPQACWHDTMVAHELGHAFGLLHDCRDFAYVMFGRDMHTGNVCTGPPIASQDPKSTISPEAAWWLNQHPAFNE